jgi:hypothetical protein
MGTSFNWRILVKTTFYAQNELNIEGMKNPIKKGEVVGVLDSPDGAPVPNIVRALVNGLASPNKPVEPKQKAADVNVEGGDVSAKKGS